MEVNLTPKIPNPKSQSPCIAPLKSRIPNHRILSDWVSSAQRPDTDIPIPQNPSIDRRIRIPFLAECIPSWPSKSRNLLGFAINRPNPKRFNPNSKYQSGIGDRPPNSKFLTHSWGSIRNPRFRNPFCDFGIQSQNPNTQDSWLKVQFQGFWIFLC